MLIANNRQKIQPIVSANRGTEDGNIEVRASTLPRRRGDVGQSSTTPSNSPNRQNSPRASTPSLDSAVGSAEGLGVVSQPVQDEIRPRSDGSDSLATSSALTSPEPPTIPGDNHHDASRPESIQSRANASVETGESVTVVQNSVEDINNSARGLQSFLFSMYSRG